MKIACITAFRMVRWAGAVALLFATSAHAQAPFLVKNIRTGTNTDGSTPQQFVRFGAHVYFAATTPATGRELWRTDGTAAGTVLFKDINPGPGDSEPERFLIANNFLFFFADDGTHGVELWRTDGTAAGTILPKDVTPGRQPLFSPSFNDSAAVGTNIFFAVGFRLWKSNGTPAGTVEVFATDITIAEITNLNAVAIFSGDLRNDTDGEELWKSDGTSAGTVRVKDINAVNTGSDPTGFRTAGTLVYFQADSPAPGLWKSDGTDAGTQLVANLGNAADPIPLGAIGNTMFFSATVGLASEGRELWKTQGTAATTTLVKDINPTSGSFPSAFTEFNGMGYFDAITSALGRELWKTDGTEAGTTLVKDCRTGSQDGRNGDIKVVFNNALYFGARNAAGPRQLWKTDGTTTVELSSSLTSSNFDSVNWIAALNNAVVFNGSRSSDGNELWKSDGTTGGTVQVKDIVAGDVSSHPAELTDVDGTLFFVASDASLSPKLWKSDGTDAGTVMVKDVPAENLVAAGNTLFFTSPVGFGDTELWKSDGTNAGTVRVKDIRVGTTGSGPSRGVEWNGLLYFTANNGTDGRELWRSDGTETGTVMVVNIAAGNADPDWLTPAGGLLYFAANHPTAERELFKTDGTAAGTVMVEDLNLSGGSHPSDLVMHGTQLFFTASDGSGTDLYKSDGTAAGTAIISMSLPGLTPVRSLAGFLFLLDNNPLTTTTVGAEPWKSDGSVAGTVLIEDIFAGVGWSGVEGVVRTSTTGFFAAADATAGRELWKTTDGTPAGTSRIADISPGLRSSNPSALMTTVGQAVFAADDGTNGNELWMSNGTTASMIHNITSGAGSSPISSIVESGPFLFFDADDGTTGVELWALPMSRLCTPPATPTITSSSPAGICVGQSVTLTAPLGYTRYQWNTGATTRAITVSPTVTTQYSVVGYNATDCPSARATHTVNVGTPLTAVSISHSGSTNVCYTSGTGGTFTVTDTGGGTVTHQWGYRNSSGTGTITNIPGETGTSYILTGSDFPSPGAYYIVVRSTPFCGTTTESNQTQISVRPPLTVATMSITGSSQVCSTSTGGTASVSTTGGDALTYQWRYRYTPTGGFQTITGATAASYVIRGSDFVPEASGPQTYFLSCLVTPACGAVRETNQNSVTVTPTPTTPSASNNGPICQGAQLQLNSSTVAGATYAWTGPNGFASALQNPTIPNASTAASGEYRVVVTVNGCPSSAGTTNVTVRPVPTANPASNSPVCEGSTLTLSTPLVTGATYSWTGPNGFTSTSRTPSIPSVTPAGGGSYTVLSTLNGCSSAPQSTDVTVNARPVVTATNSGPVCEGQAASLGATFVAGATYAWTGPNGFSSNAQNPSISDAGLSHAGTYSVVASVAGCQSPASPTTLEVNSRPSASIDAYPSVTAGAIANASVLDAGTGATYVWSITNGIIEGGQGTRNIFFTPGANGSVQLNIVVTAASGCSAQDSVAVPIVAVPLINNFNPGSGAAGASIQISGSNFVDVLAVRFNGRASEFEVLSPTSIRATVASSATSGPISVITTTGTGNSATDFVVLPRITALTPTIGRTGSWVTVTGTNLLQTSGINFGGMGANFTVLSASSVEAMVPLGATNGPIQLHTPDASTASLSDFTIEPVPYMLYTRFQVPCRLLDTRLSGGRLLHETPRIFDVVENLGAQGGNADDCGVPGNATAAMINFVAVSPTAAGNLRAAAYPKSIPPTGSIINYQSTTPPLNVANGVIFPICDSAVDDCAAGDIVIQANGGDTHLVADVLGYFTRFVRESVRPFALVRRLSSPIPLSTSCSTLMQTELHTPAEGIVVISGHATVRFAHVNGTTDEVQVTAGGSFDGCSSDPEKVARVDASEPTGTYYRTIPLHAFGLFQFGYKEFYVRGRITLASSGHSLHNAAFSVTFYPE